MGLRMFMSPKNKTPPTGVDHNSLTYIFVSGFDVNSFLLIVVLIPKLIIFLVNSLIPGWCDT